jgi:hypothetical protein
MFNYWMKPSTYSVRRTLYFLKNIHIALCPAETWPAYLGHAMAALAMIDF